MDKESRLEKWNTILNDSIVKPEELLDSKFSENIFPMAMKIAAKTLAFELLPVVPMGGGNSSEQIKKIEQEVKIENRDRKIEALVEDKEFNEMKNEEHPDYIKYKGPSSSLFYMDFIYGSSSNKI